MANGAGAQKATSTPCKLQTSRDARCRSHQDVRVGINGDTCGDLCFDVLRQLLVTFTILFTCKLFSKIVKSHNVVNFFLWRTTVKLVVGLLGSFSQLDRHTWLINFYIVNGRYKSNQRKATTPGNYTSFGFMVFHCHRKL